MEKITKKWYDKDKYGRETLLEILNDQYICIHKKQKRNLTKHVVNLLALNEKSQKVDSPATKWIIISLVLFVISVMLFKYFFSFLSWYPVLFFFPIVLLFVFMSFYSFLTYQKQNRSTQVFFSRYGLVPLISIPITKSNGYKVFVDQLERDIANVFNEKKATERSLRAGEMKMLRRLHNETFIDEHEYNIAKARILEQL